MPRGERWRTLRHNGVAFPPPYVPKGLKLGFKGYWISLGLEAEEMAYSWAKKKDGPHASDLTFRNNFWKDFQRILPPDFEGANLDDLDFSQFNAFVDMETREKLSLSTDQKRRLAAERKKVKEAMKRQFGYVEIDGRRVEIQNWMVEPPGIFVGRGLHPLRGRWKRRIGYRDVILNLDADAPIPPGNWGGIVHDRSSIWLASWKDELTGKVKYVWPHESSFIIQKNNKLKYIRAAKLGSYIDRVRDHIERGLTSDEERIRKVATVCYLIDHLCLRVGDEKDEDETDTVGATTLRVEHLKLDGDKIWFDFLGKDSVRWLKVLEEVNPSVILNLREFMVGKRPQDLVFDGVNSTKVNSFLNEAMRGLTARVFRTYHASNVVRDYLWSISDDLNEADQDIKIFHAKVANLKAAMLCNHKKTPPKNWEEVIRRREEKLKTLKGLVPKTDRQANDIRKKIRKAELALEIAKMTKEYNLNTSLKNYIDPRIYKAWSDHVGLDWTVIYPKGMQRKFSWVNRMALDWTELKVRDLHRS